MLIELKANYMVFMALCNWVFVETAHRMLVLQTPAGFEEHIGATLGPTDWRVVRQAEIDAFADLTGDDRGNHVEVARWAREAPDGRTIIHGLYVLSLFPAWHAHLPVTDDRGGHRRMHGNRGRRYFADRGWIKPQPSEWQG